MADKYMNDVASGKGKNDQNLKGNADNVRGNKMAEKSTYHGEVKPQPKGKQPSKGMEKVGDGDEC
jgi:hypothetical protein